MMDSFYNSPAQYIGDTTRPDIDFTYTDADCYENEMAELYSYTEVLDFQKNLKAFNTQMRLFNLRPEWMEFSQETKKTVVMKLLNILDITDRNLRMQAARSLLYIAQGCWGEMHTKEDLYQMTKDNVLLLYNLGVFSAFIEFLNFEIAQNNSLEDEEIKTNCSKKARDPSDLRCILSVLYILTETIRSESRKGKSEDFVKIAESFAVEINSPLPDGELLSVKLLGMLNTFCSKAALHYPIKKITLLLWKVVLVGLGGTDYLKTLKNEYRKKNNLSPIPEDTLDTSKRMRAASPPILPIDLMNRPCRKPYKKQLPRRNLKEQPEYDMSISSFFKKLNFPNDTFSEKAEKYLQMDGGDEAESSEDDTATLKDPDEDIEDKSISSSTSECSLTDDFHSFNISADDPRIPWTSKVREKDILRFLELARKKFIGFTLENDSTSVAGLPKPILEGYEVLRKHQYVSLGDQQIKHEALLEKYPLSTKPIEIPETPTEVLYKALLPTLPHYLVTLLKILLASAPTTRTKPDAINLTLELFSMKLPISREQSAKLDIDLARHKEIISKAASATLILLLKHFKLNHIYQFEFISQNLVFSNALPLLLKFFNHSIVDYVDARHNLPLLEFPNCVLEDVPDVYSQARTYNPEDDDKSYCWRNLFTCINLLRILNKLVKWKHARIMMLAVFKSGPLLKKALRIRHPTMQLYALKLLKIQIKYTSRQWRKNNMQTIGAIYAKVRHRLNDDWVYGSDIESRPWDYQAEETDLKECVERFNARRYPKESKKLSSDNISCFASFNSIQSMKQNSIVNCSSLSLYSLNNENLTSPTARMCSFIYDDMLATNTSNNEDNVEWTDENDDGDDDLPNDFKANYADWLEKEVFNNPTNWDAL